MEDAIDQVFDLAKTESKDIKTQFIKLTEEVGELANEVLVASGDNRSEKGDADGIAGECCDVAQCAISIFVKNGGTKEEFFERLGLKNSKWAGQIKD